MPFSPWPRLRWNRDAVARADRSRPPCNPHATCIGGLNCGGGSGCYLRSARNRGSCVTTDPADPAVHKMMQERGEAKQTRCFSQRWLVQASEGSALTPEKLERS